MKKLICSNPVCEKTFNFDEQKFPNAKKVKCPHCQTTQPLALSSPDKKEDEWDNIISRQPPQPATPVAPPQIPVSPPRDPAPFEKHSDPGEEDFFGRQDAPRPRPSAPPGPNPTAVPASQPGWLVIHDEQTATETFPLREGINRVGRRANDTPRDVNILINTRDTYMSRKHCEIDVRRRANSNEYEYILSDFSLNGTYVNAGKRLAKGQSVSLRDGDTVQIGRTKLVLVLPSSNPSAQSPRDRVSSKDYFHTIIE
jgi:pSer/pThr/pTyr-binding forkhead associated (FHA) protein